MPDHYADDIYSDINRKKQLEDAQENKEFDRDIEAYRRGQKNLTDEERLERMKDITAKRKQLKDNLLRIINNPESQTLVKSNLRGRALQAQKRRNKRIAEGNTGIAPSEIPGKIIDFGESIAEDPAAMSEQMLDFYTDIQAAGKGAQAGSKFGPVGAGVGAAGAIMLKRIGKEGLENLGRNLIRNIRGKPLVPAIEAVGDSTFLSKTDDIGSQPLMSKGSGSGTVGSGQLNVVFPHEQFITKPRRGAAKIGEDVTLVADKSRKVPQRLFTKKDIDFNTYRLNDGTYDIDRFERNIRDLLEADQIRALDVPVGELHKVKGTTRTLKKIVGSDSARLESLYGDYLAGYFNTYGNLDNIARLKTPSGKIIPTNNRDLVRNLRIFRMNPQLFYSGGREAFNPKIRTGTYNSQLKQIITENKTTKQFIEGTKLQRHHLAVIDEIWPLFDGLIGNDVDRMRNALKDLGIFVGNDPKNLALVPKRFHNAIVHDVLWKAFRPSWAGRTGKIKALQLDMRSMSFKERVNAGFVDEFKESMDIINRQLDLGIKEFINRKGSVNSKNVNELKEFLQTIVDIDIDI